ncbi:MAG: hypothetical protein P8Y95_16125, partial [Gammaproteobacteria bacterium]
LFTMLPDGSGRQCITCNAAIPKGFVGQPSWHPDGVHIVIQVESEHSNHRFYHHMSWGIDNDLWIVSRDGKTAKRIWETPKGLAALHPQFSADGRTLIFAERVPTGRKLRRPIARALAPGGENQWTGWRIHQAQFDITTMTLSRHRTMKPNGEGFYETHGFHARSVVYSHTDGGQTYVDDIFTTRFGRGASRNLTNSPHTWDEHGQFSPLGDFAFISSRIDPTLEFPGPRPSELRTELFVKAPDGAIRQITDMNQRKGRRIAVSDFDWDRDGRRIAFQVAVIDGSVNPEVWVVSLR